MFRKRQACCGAGGPAGAARESNQPPQRRVAFREAAAADWPAIKELLQTAGLSADGLERWRKNTIVAALEGRIVGVVAIEVYGEAGLIRSLAVREDIRGRGLGTALARAAEHLALRRGVGSVFLLTETADGFFSKLGYATISRDGLPPAMRQSELLDHVCPQSARAMVRSLV